MAHVRIVCIENRFRTKKDAARSSTSLEISDMYKIQNYYAFHL